MKKHLLILCFLFSFFISSASILSDKAKVYLFTCQPGTEIYATFGHSAFYIQDKENSIDIVFNYGIFSFDAENFLYKFLKGETFYMLGIQDYENFLWGYEHREMGVSSQELNLTPEEKDQLYLALITNALPENREYLYNFFYDNCATRLRDMTEDVTNGTIIYPNFTQKQTYRDLVAMFTGKNTWLKFGIDILVGAPADKMISNHDKMFLPYFLRDNYSQAYIEKDGQKKKLVISSQQLIPDFPRQTASILLSPLTAMCLLFFVALAISIRNIKKKTQNLWFDFILFLLVGIIGMLVTFITFFSIHPAVFPNYNILWIQPLYIIFAILLCFKNIRYKLAKYHYFNILMLASAFVLSLFAQSFNLAFYPLMLTLCLRSSMQIYFAKKNLP